MPTLAPALVGDHRGLHDQRLAGRRVRSQCRDAVEQSRPLAQVPATSMQRGDLDGLLRRTRRLGDHTCIAIHMCSNSLAETGPAEQHSRVRLAPRRFCSTPTLEERVRAVDSAAAPASTRAEDPSASPRCPAHAPARGCLSTTFAVARICSRSPINELTIAFRCLDGWF
jgi:hypothetical protein